MISAQSQDAKTKCSSQRRRLVIRNRVLFHSPGKVGKPMLFFQQNQTIDGKSYVAVKNYMPEETEEELNDRMEQLNARREQGGTAALGAEAAGRAQPAPIPTPTPEDEDSATALEQARERSPAPPPVRTQNGKTRSTAVSEPRAQTPERELTL